jgi:hypothetical protein
MVVCGLCEYICAGFFYRVLGYPISNSGRIGISLTVITQPHFCSYLNTGPGLPTSYVLVYLLCPMSWGERWLFVLLVLVECCLLTDPLHPRWNIWHHQLGGMLTNMFMQSTEEIWVCYHNNMFFFECTICTILYLSWRGHRGRNRMVVGFTTIFFTTTYAIRAYRHLSCEFEPRVHVLDITLCDKVWQWLVTGRWSFVFSGNSGFLHQ